MSQNPVILKTDGNELTGGVQAGITQASVGQRTTRQDGKTKLEQLNAIKIVYNAELKGSLTCFGRLILCIKNPFTCRAFDIKRSYLYLRENSIESNVAYSNYCGYCGGAGDDVEVIYFDQDPYASSPCVYTACGPCYGPAEPKLEVIKMGTMCCCTYVEPCCGPNEVVVIMPFESYCFCCVNRTSSTCCGLYGPPAGNPVQYTAFRVQPKNPSEFCKISQQVMYGRGG